MHLSRPALLPGAPDERLAYVHTRQNGAEVCFLFCGGFRSDMTGSKALAVEASAARLGQSALRFDYFGHGASSGDFAEGSIGRWKEDCLAVVDALTDGLPVILVGSSMGGWLALLTALARPDRVVGLLGLAAAPDFTRKLMWANASQVQQQQLLTEGRIEQPNDYSDQPYLITRQLIEEGDRHLLLDAPIALTCPVRLFHGLRDQDVPLWVAEQTFARLASPDCTLTLVKQGDHRLSEPGDLARLDLALEELLVAVQRAAALRGEQRR